MTRVLQINTNGAQVADALIEDLAERKEADVFIISEQYRYRVRNNQTWYASGQDMAAVWVTVDHRTLIKEHGRDTDFVWMCIGDVTFVSVYLSPNLRMPDFRKKVDKLEDKLRSIPGHVIVAGDFSARATEWGMPATNSKGKYLLEKAARLNLVVANEGSVTTSRTSSLRLNGWPKESSDSDGWRSTLGVTISTSPSR